ncbi:Hypothetical protein, putative [Bodo saltans]|uniref:Uncharacterized protein n=1 Tax=Bodo saltans TaxID=75058 RepID=A0A0S4KL88_BODSA|nr:Hypothetical protein, putative [Bodo saltans]|eukprot:CUI15371.1 Hypothetical protein, putative [Bodo saltans]
MMSSAVLQDEGERRSRVVSVMATSASAVETLVSRHVDVFQSALCIANSSDKGAIATEETSSSGGSNHHHHLNHHNAEKGGVRDGIVVVFTNEKGFKELPLHIRSKIDLAVFVVNRPMPAREAAATLLAVSDRGAAAAAAAVAGIPGGGSELIKTHSI